MRRSAFRCAHQRTTSAATSAPVKARSQFSCVVLAIVSRSVGLPIGRGLDRPGIIPPAPFPFVKHGDSAAFMAPRVVDILVPVALDQTYSYRVPDELALAPGDVVCVPLGARTA